MPVTDHLDEMPPMVKVYADDPDMLPARDAPWPGSDRARPDPFTFDLGRLVLSRPDVRPSPVKLRRENQAAGTVVVGGEIRHDPTRHLTWEDWHDSYGAVVEPDGVSFIGTRFCSLGDGVSFVGGPWRLVGCWFSDIYDDAIQNDRKHPGLVDSCVLDGVHIGFSAASVAPPVDRMSSVRIVNSMVRLRPQVESYKPDKYNPVTNPAARTVDQVRKDPAGQHGPFFKWSSDMPGPDVRDCIFRADEPSSYGGSLRLPPGSTGSNVVLIGTEAWDPADVESWTSQIDGVRFGSVDDWDRALANRSALNP